MKSAMIPSARRKWITAGSKVHTFVSDVTNFTIG